MIKVFHLSMLTKDERDALNGPNGGWDSNPRFARYANITMMADRDAATIAMLEGEYHMVAAVDTDDLEEAWKLTNHIESDWTGNDKVTALPGDPRSSSVGDLFIYADDRKPAVHIVKGCGFEPLVDTPKPERSVCDNLGIFK